MIKMRKLHNKEKIDRSNLLLRKDQQGTEKGGMFWNSSEDFELHTRPELQANVMREKNTLNSSCGDSYLEKGLLSALQSYYLGLIQGMFGKANENFKLHTKPETQANIVKGKPLQSPTVEIPAWKKVFYLHSRAVIWILIVGIFWQGGKWAFWKWGKIGGRAGWNYTSQENRFKGLSWSFQGLLSVPPVRNSAGCCLWHGMGTVTSDRTIRRARSRLRSLRKSWVTFLIIKAIKI